MVKPLVSVIITTKNSSRTLDKCLKSIKEQTYKNIELIVVDNNSSDTTKEIAKKYTKLVFNKGPERSAQRNFGAKKAKGKYLYIIDSDFILDQKVIQQCIMGIKKGFDAMVVHNTPDESISWIAKIRKFEVDMYKYDLTYSAARFFKKEIFKKIGGYTESITAAEDYDIQNKLNRNNFKTGFIDAEAIHLGEPTSFWKHMLNYYNYGKDLVNYKSKNSFESKKQLSPFRSAYTKNWKKFIKKPLTGLIFIIYSFFKFFFGGLGYLTNKINLNLYKYLIKSFVLIIKGIFLFLYPLILLFPKNDKIWVFGTGNGKKYNENSKALFEYIVKNHPEIKAIWLTRNKKIKTELIKNKKEAHTFFSPKGIYFSLIAKVLVISTSFLDINPLSYIFPKKIKIIQLWHGTPLKILTNKHFDFKKKILLEIFTQYLGKHSDLIISATKKNIKIYKSLGHKIVKITGQPRNDILVTENKKNKKITITYLPTYRGYDNQFDFFLKYGFNLNEFDIFLKKNKAQLIVNLHSCNEKQNKKIKKYFKKSKNIILNKKHDIYQILSKTDILITDYSSVYFDFLLLNRPIIFAPFDLKEYTKRIGFYYKYSEVTPGQKTTNWVEIKNYLNELFSGKDKYLKNRMKINNIFNKYKDQNNSERVYKEILKIIK